MHSLVDLRADTTDAQSSSDYRLGLMETMSGFFSQTKYDFCVIHHFSLFGLSEMSKFQKSLAKASLISFIAILENHEVSDRSTDTEKGKRDLTFVQCNHVYHRRKDEMHLGHHEQTPHLSSAATSLG